MFSLLYGFWQYLSRKVEYNVLVLGVDSAGKTTFVEKVKEQFSGARAPPPEKILPTVGLNIGRVETQKCKIVFWDLGGQKGLRSIWDKYFEEAHSVVYVVDSSDPSRLEENRSALRGIIGSKDLEAAPVLVVANKQDRPDALEPEAVLGALDLGGRPRLEHKVQPMSALRGEGVTAGVSWLMEAMKKGGRMAVGNPGQAASSW